MTVIQQTTDAMEGGAAGIGSQAQGDTIEPESWWGKQKKEASSFVVEDCAECRYIAGIGMYATALFVGYTSIKRQKLLGAKIWGALPALVVSGAMIGLGTARLLRINPFTHSGNETGIDVVDQFIRKLSQPQDNGDKDDNAKR